jgi:glycosyltransferase involved in cell wall biosynthesis
MRLGITAIVKDEGLYLKEWLIFHSLQTVDAFFIYDNGSTDNTREIVEQFKLDYPYLQVNLIDWQGRCQQLPAYNHSVKNNKDVDWMAFLDADEFLYSPKGYSIKEYIETITHVNYKIAGVVAKWKLFGSAGADRHEKGLVIERFTKCADRVDQHCKSIMRMDQLISAGRNTHTFRSTGIIVDEDMHTLPYEYATLSKAGASTICINHYHTKSKEEYRLRCQKGCADSEGQREFEISFSCHDRNEAEDTYLRDAYTPLIRDKIYEE